MWRPDGGRRYELTPRGVNGRSILDTGTGPRVRLRIRQNGDVHPLKTGRHLARPARPRTRPWSLRLRHLDSVPWSCPTAAVAAGLPGWPRSARQDSRTDVTQRQAFFGVDFWTNVEVNSFPPGVSRRPRLRTDAARGRGAALPERRDDQVHGCFEIVLPKASCPDFFIPADHDARPARSRGSRPIHRGHRAGSTTPMAVRVRLT